MSAEPESVVFTCEGCRGPLYADSIVQQLPLGPSIDPQTGEDVPLYPVAYSHPECEDDAVAHGRYGHAVDVGQLNVLQARRTDEPPASEGSVA